MFYSKRHTNKKADRGHQLARLADVAIEFATLGEYRVVIDEPRIATDQPSLWAAGVDWSTPARRRSSECSLPRVHDRGSKLLIGQ